MSQTQINEEASGLDARRAALDVASLLEKGRALDEALEQCRSFDALTGADRAFARAMIAAVLRRRGSLDHMIGAYIDRPLPKRASRVMDILRLAGAQLLVLGTPDHAAVSTAVDLTHERKETAGYAKLVNAIARKLARQGQKALNALPPRTDTPGWLWRSWERHYGPQAARAIAAAHRKEAPLDLTLKDAGDVDLWAQRLGARIMPNGTLRLSDAAPVAELDGYGDGAWWVQDFAASLPARLLGDIEGKRVFDLCAAPGGKTMQLAARSAQVIAVDRAEKRLERLSENLGRTGLTAELVTADILTWKPEGPADAILLDAPCSATGTIRRHPDIPWSKEAHEIEGLAKLQAELIDRACAMLKPGGLLVYCVCSLQKEEGEAQAEAALARLPDLNREPVGPTEISGLNAAVTRQGDLRTLPSMVDEAGGMDGFFAARLRKQV